MIKITQNIIQPWQWLAEQESSLIKSGALTTGGFGATASFIGTMRDLNLGKEISKMTLIHYPGMAEKELGKIAQETMENHDVLHLRLIHRTGLIKPADTIVVVVVWSAHRKAAFDACRAIMQALKNRAPFWKKEQSSSGSHWLSKNTAG